MPDPCRRKKTESGSGKVGLNLMFLTLIVTSFLLLLVPVALADDSDNIIRVGVFQNEPLVIIDQEGQVRGPCVEIIEAIAEEQGWNIDYIRGSREENLERLDNGSIDILVAVPHSPEMDERYTLTEESVTTMWGVAYIHRDSGIGSMQDLQGKKIAVDASDLFYRDLNASVAGTNISYLFVETGSYMEVLELVDEEHVDAGIVSNLYGDSFENNYAISRMSLVIAPTDIVFALPVNSDVKTADLIDREVAQLRSNLSSGQYLSVSSQPSLNTWESPTWLKLTVGAGGGLLLLLIVLSFILKNKIEAKTAELNSKNRELEIEVRERMAAEKKLKTYFAQLKHSNELKDLFTDILRHDLINPATVIKGYVEHLLEYEEDEQKTAALRAIERNNLKLIEMIENAASLAKLESVEELDFEEMDIGTILDEVVQTLKPKADEKQIRIAFSQVGNYPAKVNRIIEDVFSNLISNSIKYSPEGSRIEVTLSEWKDLGWKVSIIDEGDGISDHDKPLVFDRFERVGKMNIKGTGLGLAIVKRIVELHDGDVGIEDNPSGKGSLFWVTLHR